MQNSLIARGQIHMKKKPEGKEKRLHKRVADPGMSLKIGETPYRSINWSMGGILVDDYDGKLSTGSLLTITEIGPLDEEMTAVNIRARVVRADSAAGNLAVQILELDSPAYGVFQELMSQRLKVVKSP